MVGPYFREVTKSMGIVALESLAVGEGGRITDISGDPNFVTRLNEMGLRVGTALRMIRSGRPCLIAVDHQRLSFRTEDNVLILVELCDDAGVAACSPHDRKMVRAIVH
jgi:ferrous iron transport protein A